MHVHLDTALLADSNNIFIFDVPIRYINNPNVVSDLCKLSNL